MSHVKSPLLVFHSHLWFIEQSKGTEGCILYRSNYSPALQAYEEFLKPLTVDSISICDYFFQRPLEGNRFFETVVKKSEREPNKKLLRNLNQAHF
jgi:hypothetical protein